MSAWLVDTHAILWFLADDRRLSEPALDVMRESENVLLVSSASIWEMALKSSAGKLDVPDDLPDLLPRAGFERLVVEHEDAWAVRELPAGEHKDPFDRLLVAQAKRHDLPLISGDARLDAYAIRRHW